MATATVRPDNPAPTVQAQIAATVRYACPACGLIQQTKITYTKWQATCKNKHCGREWIIGMVFYQLDNPRKQGRRRPPDTIFDTYRNGSPVHQLHADAVSAGR